MIIHTVNALFSERGCCCNVANCFTVVFLYLTPKWLLMQCPQLFCHGMFIFRPSFVTSDEWNQVDCRGTSMGTRSVSNSVAGLYWSCSMPWIKKAVSPIPTIILLLHVHIWHIGRHVSLVMNGVKVTEEGQVWVQAVCQMVLWVYTDHTPVMPCVFRKRSWMQCSQLFAVACSYLTQRPSFFTCNEWNQVDCRRTGMGTRSVSNSIAGLYWSCSMLYI
jgi:hypothetical protein